ncbi:MAG TPA: hypothetical protein VEU33_26540 [Archangium sp.]|nr:hypothetical protein [Archangium sp.]
MSHVSWPRAYFERIRPTFLESWTEDLRALAVSHVHLLLTQVEARVAQASHLGSAVFDVLCDTGAGDGAPSRVWLLDANPWGPASDACLFDWSQPEGFDGSFRYLE